MNLRFTRLLAPLVFSACHAATPAPAPATPPAAPPAHPANAGAAPTEDTLVDEHVRAIAAKACPAVDPDVCSWAEGFLGGTAPTLPTTKAWTLGAGSEVGTDGKKQGPRVYVVLAIDPTHPASVGVMDPTTENAEEERIAENAVADFRKGAPDPKNALVQFVNSHLENLAWMESSKSTARSLVLTTPHTGPGSVIVRAQRGTLYFVQLAFASSADDYDLRPHWLMGSAGVWVDGMSRPHAGNSTVGHDAISDSR